MLTTDYLGPYGCIGRPLALLNIRTTVSRLLLTYSFELASGETGGRFEEESREHFTLAPGDLMIRFSKQPNQENHL